MAKQYKALMLPIELHEKINKLAKKNNLTMIELVDRIEQLLWAEKYAKLLHQNDSITRTITR